MHAERCSSIRGLALALGLVIGLSAVPAAAAPHPTKSPLDFPFFSQLDPAWAGLLIGAHEDVLMLRMGSLLTCVAMVAASYRLQPIFPVPGTVSYGTVTPDYIHAFLHEHDRYLESPPKTVIIDYMGLGDAFFTNDGVPAGIDLLPMSWPAGRTVVDGALDAGHASILYLQPSPNRYHPVVAVGWDAETASYLIADPARLRWDMAPRPIREVYGARWEEFVTGALRAVLWTPSLIPVLPDDDVAPAPLVPPDDDIPLSPLTVSTKSPVEVTGVDPFGRRVGFDVASGATVMDVPGATYLPQPVWADPTGVLPARPPGRMLTIPHPVDGRYRFEMIATGDGPFTLNVLGYDAGRQRVVHERRTGTVTAGEVLRFQVEYARSGESHFTMGNNFAPEAHARAARRTTPGTAMAFDGSDSFDVDGTLTSHRWDFGDGTTAVGGTASHTYAAAGTYTATLTVTDDHGATGTDAAEVAVYGVPATAGTTARMSVGTGGTETAGDRGSFNPALSGDGRYLAFESWTTSLGSPTGGIFVRDRHANTTTRVSPTACSSARFPTLNADGRFVAFECQVVNPATGAGMSTVVVHDRFTGADERADVSTAGDAGTCAGAGCGSVRPALSSDGRFVAFYSDHPDLVPGDTNTSRDAFVRDRQAGTTERVSVSAAGGQATYGASTSGPQLRLGLSADGRFVAFVSSSTDLVPGTPPFFLSRIYVRDREQHTTELVSVTTAGTLSNVTGGDQPSISADGRLVAFWSGSDDLVAGDTNKAPDVFVRDREAGTTERVNLTGAGGQAVCGPFSDLSACTRNPVISDDGRFVVFRSLADNCVLDDTNRREDVFVRDLQRGATEIVSVSTAGEQGNGHSGEAHFTNDATQMAVSGDGRFVAFSSDATNLAGSDGNGLEDVFERDRRPASPVADASGPYLGFASTPGRPAHVTFDASRSVSSLGQPLTARWDFGDGSPIAEAAASDPIDHAFAAPGRYLVTLLVTDGERRSTPAGTIAVIEAPAVPVLELLPACGWPGDRIGATASGSPLVPVAGGWNLDDGPAPAARTVHPAGEIRVVVDQPNGGDPAEEVIPIDAFSASGLALSARFGFTVGGAWAPGTYTVRAPDEGNATAQFTVPCPPLANEPPQADSGGPYAGTVGSPIVLDGRSSRDPEGAPLTFAWYFEDDAEPSAGPRPSHIFQAPGTYWVLLIVHDGQIDSPTSAGTRSYTTVTITGGPPATVTTTQPAPSTTTTTTLPSGGACASEPPAPTFRSVDCRLGALHGQTSADVESSELRRRLVARLGKGRVALGQARSRCADGQTRPPKGRLKRLSRRLVQFARAVQSRAAHHHGLGVLGASLAARANEIRTDVRILRRRLRCPSDTNPS